MLILGIASVVWAGQAVGRRSDPLFGIGFDDRLDAPATLPAVLARTSSTGRQHPIHIRLVVPRRQLEPAPGQYDFAALDARLASYRQVPAVDLYLDVRGLPEQADALPAWTTYVRALAQHVGTSVAGYVVGAEGRAATVRDASTFAFVVKATSVDLRAASADAAVVLGGLTVRDVDWLGALYDADLTPYVDGIAAASLEAAGNLSSLVERRAPAQALVAVGVSLGDSTSAAMAQLAGQHASVLGTRVSGVTYDAPAAVVDAALPALDAMRDLIDQPLATLDERAAGLTVSPSPEAGPHRLLFGLSNAATYFIATAVDAPEQVSLIEPSGARPVIRDPARLARLVPTRFDHDPATGRSTVAVPASATPLIVDWSQPDATRIDRAEVSATALPSLAEIIARHQQAQATQDARLQRYVTDAQITQQFRPNAADSGYDVVTENRFFVQGRQVEFDERSFRLNGTPWGSDRPPFPLLQAEKVLSLPLELRLTTDYRYTFEGLAEVDGRACFVLRFDPLRSDESLFRGTVWIDRQTYLKLKVHTIQTALGAPVLTSEETQRFARVGTLDGRDVWLLVDLVGRQNIMLAGRSVLLERRMAFQDFQLNPADFDRQRDEARASDHVMYRDTDRGLRYLVKRGDTRVVDEATTAKAKALLIGVDVDPSYDYPLPLGGINYLNFSFLGPESQLAVVYGGVLALVNVQRPHLIGRSIDGSADLFAIAVPSSDRVYDASGERPGERLLTIPFSTGLNLGWRATEHLRVLGNYQFHYDWFGHDRTTADGFVVPTSTATHGVGGGVEWREGGYALAASGLRYRRVTWNSWGYGLSFDPAQRDYTRYNASLSRDFFSGAHKVHLNAGYYGGRQLDRFSQYQFGLFDEHRIRGVPSSGVRFSTLAMARASYAFNFFDQYRAEIEIDQAYGRDPEAGPDWQRITGLGAGVLVRGPHQTILRVDVGKSFLPPRYREPGSFILQVQILKPL
jgi:hypothetical protein